MKIISKLVFWKGELRKFTWKNSFRFPFFFVSFLSNSGKFPKSAKIRSCIENDFENTIIHFTDRPVARIVGAPVLVLAVETEAAERTGTEMQIGKGTGRRRVRLQCPRSWLLHKAPLPMSNSRPLDWERLGMEGKEINFEKYEQKFEYSKSEFLLRKLEIFEDVSNF